MTIVDELLLAECAVIERSFPEELINDRISFDSILPANFTFSIENTGLGAIVTDRSFIVVLTNSGFLLLTIMISG